MHALGSFSYQNSLYTSGHFSPIIKAYFNILPTVLTKLWILKQWPQYFINLTPYHARLSSCLAQLTILGFDLDPRPTGKKISIKHLFQEFFLLRKHHWLFFIKCQENIKNNAFLVKILLLITIPHYKSDPRENKESFFYMKKEKCRRNQCESFSVPNLSDLRVWQ
jgi:hypothetical protein